MPEQPPILFIHGAFSRGSHCDAWARYFSAAGFECHAPSLPGHEPPDLAALARLGMDEFLAALQVVRSALPGPPIVIGHSMGGLLGQQLAATGPCAALVCLAAAPPWMLRPQPRSLPYFLPLARRILSGQPLIPSERTLRYLALHDLLETEQTELLKTVVPESGRAYRSMVLGTARVKVSKVRCPVLCLGGDQDRIVACKISRKLATLYKGDHLVLEGRGHWLLSRTGHEKAAGVVLQWLERRLQRMPGAESRT
ncbi:MAG TPA: alpha/beta hydrolase [Thermoanaerobaculia bacterium]|jgi:pimeloyl-ACP methyl ester carboxylesterase|nr:alpha/beta hydrolase [Thermoanaerobaculia bacterium]